jgi:hypothetical protein
VLHVIPVAGGAPAALSLPHGVDRIEVMGTDAVVVGTGAGGLHFSGIALEGAPRVTQRYVSRGATQGEERSHGFFYRQDAPDEGVIGLPVGRPGRAGYEDLFSESAAVLFLRNDGGSFQKLGELASHPETARDDECVASCIDWYGNSRPLFLRGRIFALLGYEVVEGALRGGRMDEVRRISFAPAHGLVTRR